MFQRFTDRGRRAVVLAQDEARRLDHNYIGTEHILLGLIREGGGVAPQVLVKLGADPNRVRQQVIQIREDTPETEVQDRLDAVEDRLAPVEQWVGTRPDTSHLDEQIGQVRREKESAVDAHDYEQAAALRNREKKLLAAKAARQEQWIAGTRRCRIWPSDASSSPTRSSDSVPCSVSTASTRKTSQPDVRLGSALQPVAGPGNLRLDRASPTAAIPDLSPRAGRRLG